MCLLGSTPDPPEPVKPVAAPTEASDAVSNAAEEERKRRARAKGVGNSILTGAGGDTSSVPVSGKTLLGQ